MDFDPLFEDINLLEEDIGNDYPVPSWDGKIPCPNCQRRVRDFVIVDDKCDWCRIEAQRVNTPHQLDWADVRRRRKFILRDTDQFMLPDRPANSQNQVKPLRQELRDITALANPIAAWKRLDELETLITLL